MTTDTIAVPMKLPFLLRVWHGVFLGFLLGLANLVFNNPDFKGQILESEYAFSYFAFTTVFWLIGGAIDFNRTRYPKPKSLSGTVFYWILVVVLFVSIVARMLYLYPGGVGLFHPTHSMSVASGVRICIRSIASDKRDTEDVKMRFCECYSEFFMTALEHGDSRSPLEISKSAAATCRPK